MHPGPSRRPSSPKSRSGLVEHDPWGLGLSSDLPPDDTPSPSRLLRRRADPAKHEHPLYRTESPPTADAFPEVLSDVSRPNLTRLTSDLERRAGSSRGNGSEEGSRRGSTDRLRLTKESTEVEVLIHQVQANESLAGIALLYGIDLATLRKTNKLWPSDPVHLRRHLYVPLEACKWSKASETLIKGPGEGQVTLESKTKGKGREGNLIDLDDPGDQPPGEAADSWGFSPTLPTSPLVDHPNHTNRRTVDIVRIPSSQLRFFPKPPRPPDPSRTSFDSGPRPFPPPLSIQNDLHYSHQPDLPRKSSGMVKLRPPISAPASGSGLADKFSNLFFIPPPPPGGLLPPPKARPSLDSARSSPRGSTVASPILSPARPVEEVEMLARRGSGETIKRGGQKERRKLD